MSKIRVCVIGAAGRMGRRLVTAIVESSDLQLSGAVEIAGNPLLGSDAGTVAGVGAAGVLITDNLDEALKNSDAVINFSTSGVVEAAKKCVAANCSAVIGTTALPDADKDALKELAKTGRIVLPPI